MEKYHPDATYSLSHASVPCLAFHVPSFSSSSSPFIVSLPLTAHNVHNRFHRHDCAHRSFDERMQFGYQPRKYAIWSSKVHMTSSYPDKEDHGISASTAKNTENIEVQEDLSWQQLDERGMKELEKIAEIPCDLDPDLMDDIVYDRGPLNEGKIQVFGGWLDENSAGRKAGSQRASADDLPLDPKKRQEELERRANDEKAQLIFAKGLQVFNVGEYAQAVTLFDQAKSLVGASSRMGGQYMLWLAQALDAAGDRKQARSCFTKLSLHKDDDVRRVASELLYILNAPRLKLDENSYVKIPDFREKDISLSKRSKRKKFNIARSSGEYAQLVKGPEKYSIEWYLAKEKPPPVENNDRQIWILIVLIIVVLFTISSA